MADTSIDTSGSKDPVQPEDRALENLAELEPALKAAAIVGADGGILASTGIDEENGKGWESAAREMVSSLAEAGGSDLDSAHLATDQAEVFIVREGDVSLVAVTGRFVLASLTSFDMRMTLRDARKGAEGA